MNCDSDLQIAGDILEVPHLLPPAPEHPSTVADFAGIARLVAAERGRWRHLVRYDATTRWSHRLRTGPGYEMWLLSWVPGQGSGAHRHGRSSGVLTVLDGALTEHTRRGAHTLVPGAQRVFPPGYVHSVVNDSLEPAVSVHINYLARADLPAGETDVPARTARRDTSQDPTRQDYTSQDPMVGAEPSAFVRLDGHTVCAEPSASLRA